MKWIKKDGYLKIPGDKIGPTMVFQELTSVQLRSSLLMSTLLSKIWPNKIKIVSRRLRKVKLCKIGSLKMTLKHSNNSGLMPSFQNNTSILLNNFFKKKVIFYLTIKLWKKLRNWSNNRKTHNWTEINIVEEIEWQEEMIIIIAFKLIILVSLLYACVWL